MVLQEIKRRRGRGEGRVMGSWGINSCHPSGISLKLWFNSYFNDYQIKLNVFSSPRLPPSPPPSTFHISYCQTELLEFTGLNINHFIKMSNMERQKYPTALLKMDSIYEVFINIWQYIMGNDRWLLKKCINCRKHYNIFSVFVCLFLCAYFAVVSMYVVVEDRKFL